MLSIKDKILNRLHTLEPDFKFNDSLKETYNLIHNYFFNPAESKLDTRKGILITGSIGSGKTLLFRTYESILNQMNHNQKFTLISALELQKNYMVNGYESIIKYLDNPISNQYNVLRKEPFNICLDDIGIENEKLNYYGNNFDVINSFLLDRYDLFKYSGVITHGTSNLSNDILFTRYDSRTTSRFVEMFNIININSDDYRLKKIKLFTV